MYETTTDNNYTTEEIDEAVKCASNTQYFIENYFYIRHPVKGKVLLDLYDHQESVLESIENNDRVMVMSARQLGITTVNLAYILWLALFNRFQRVAIVGDKFSSAKDMLSVMKFAIEELPSFLKPTLKVSNKRTIELDNDSVILANGPTDSAVRGYALSLLYCDQFGYAKRQDEFWESAYPLVAASNCKTLISSTPPPKKCMFTKLWKQPDSKFSKVHLTWRDNPNLDDEFKEEMIKLIGQAKWHLEYECELVEDSV